MDFVVDRKTWFRGKGSEGSKLLRADGRRCCIGFVGQQCGVSDEAMLNASDIRAMFHAELDISLFPAWMHSVEENVNESIGFAYGFNDDEEISDAKRETRLSELFKKNGDTITFVD